MGREVPSRRALSTPQRLLQVTPFPVLRQAPQQSTVVSLHYNTLTIYLLPTLPALVMYNTVLCVSHRWGCEGIVVAGWMDDRPWSTFRGACFCHAKFMGTHMLPPSHPIPSHPTSHIPHTIPHKIPHTHPSTWASSHSTSLPPVPPSTTLSTGLFPASTNSQSSQLLKQRTARYCTVGFFFVGTFHATG